MPLRIYVGTPLFPGTLEGTDSRCSAVGERGVSVVKEIITHIKVDSNTGGKSDGFFS